MMSTGIRLSCFFMLVTGLAACQPTLLTPIPVPTIASAPVPLLDERAPTIVPLDSELNFEFEEAEGQFTLKLRTQRIYAVHNNEINASLTRPDFRTLWIDVDGIVECIMCLETKGPARKDVDLGGLTGEYRLVFSYLAQNDSYRLDVTPEEVTLTPGKALSLTHAVHLSWRRLPAEAIWVVVHDRVAYLGDGVWKPLNRSVYEEQAGQFFQELEALGAKQFIPDEGYYTNFLFIPPWETWHEPKPDGDWVTIPLAENRWYEFRWPDIRYYQYDGDWTQVKTLIDAYNARDITVWGYNWAGETVFGPRD
jgi:hypothetical protein